MKTLYLVRHGESTYNMEERYQPADSMLSEKGVQQAQTLAQRFRAIPVEVILSSPFVRARQTAEIINGTVGKEIVYTELLQEIRRPAEVIGRPEDDPEVQRIFQSINGHAEDPGWHYSDEESFTDFKQRGIKFLELLEGKTEENILAVSHGAAMRMIICLMMNKDLGWEFYSRFWNFFKTKNTGITVLYKKEEKGWRLLTWNDHAHLGEL